MSEERSVGTSKRAWLKRATSDLGDLSRRAFVGTAYWAGYASTPWQRGRNRRLKSLPPARAIITDREVLKEEGTVACITILTVQPWAGDLLVDRFLNGYVAQLQLLDGFRQAIIARDHSNSDLYVAMTLWDSPAQAQAAPELPEQMQQFILIRSKTLEIMGRRFRSMWDGVERRRAERRRGRDRRQASALS